MSQFQRGNGLGEPSGGTRRCFRKPAMAGGEPRRRRGESRGGGFARKESEDGSYFCVGAFLSLENGHVVPYV